MLRYSILGMLYVHLATHGMLPGTLADGSAVRWEWLNAQRLAHVTRTDGTERVYKVTREGNSMRVVASLRVRKGRSDSGK